MFEAIAAGRVDVFAPFRTYAPVLAVLSGRNGDLARAVLCAWQSVPVRWALPPTPEVVPNCFKAYYRWLCDGCSIRLDDWNSMQPLCDVACLPEPDAAIGLKLAMLSRLVFPDGSTHEEAMRYIDALGSAEMLRAGKV